MSLKMKEAIFQEIRAVKPHITYYVTAGGFQRKQEALQKVTFTLIENTPQSHTQT